mmetsp:Transcript_26159/g.51360  ORF Transcript_26159/g.51360 Transcript_26159/m.51360 type:complete len:210 (-) Transcript_26159:1930-2559(-)
MCCRIFALDFPVSPPFPNENAFREVHVSPNSSLDVQSEDPTLSLTIDPKSPAGLENRRLCALSSPWSSSSFACFLMKFISTGSSTSAARLKRSSSISTTFPNVSRKIPLILHRTSTRGRPNSSRGSNSNLTIRPVASFTGRAPTRASTTATLSPLVLMASKPQSVTATVSGNGDSSEARPSSRAFRVSASRTAFAISCPLLQAAGEGIL